MRLLHTASTALILLGLTLTSSPLYAQPAIVVTRPTGAQGDLPSVRAMDAARGLVFRVYYDSVSRQAALNAVPILADMYAELAQNTGANGAMVEWAAVAFVSDRSYVSPRIGNEVRWTVTVEPTGAIGRAGERDLYVTIPHEQIHSIQSSLVGKTPRWFSEGQAEWAGLIVTEQQRPVFAVTERREKAAAFSGVPRRLSSWGGITISQKAMLRQMTAEQRAHHAQDPTYMPPGPWTLGSADMISDESELSARYGAALALFAGIERAKGRDQLANWFRQLWKEGNPLTTEAITASARAMLQIDLTSTLQ